jgi:hypothetical protein
MLVGMPLLRATPVGGFDLVGGRSWLNTEDFVWIASAGHLETIQEKTKIDKKYAMVFKRLNRPVGLVTLLLKISDRLYDR